MARADGVVMMPRRDPQRVSLEAGGRSVTPRQRSHPQNVNFCTAFPDAFACQVSGRISDSTSLRNDVPSGRMNEPACTGWVATLKFGD